MAELLSDASAAQVAAAWKKRSWREHASTTRGSISCFSSEGDWYLWWVDFNAHRCKGGSDEGCGVILTYEAVRYWCRKFGQASANQLRRRRPRPGATWHLDEVFLTIHKERHYLWRAVDQDGHVLDILVQRRRDKTAAKRCFRKLFKGVTDVPRAIITDKLASYGAAKRERLPGVEHRQHRYLNNRAENSHQPMRQRERRMEQCMSAGHAQRFLAAYGPIAEHFRPRRHILPACEYRQKMAQRFQIWREVTGTARAA